MNEVKNYISFRFETEQFYIEIDSDGYASRQIIIDDNGSTQLSCIHDCLAEVSVTEYVEEIDECYIYEKEFEKVWHHQTASLQEKWNSWKRTLRVGEVLSGKILYHYPQGWIVAINSNFGVLKSDSDYSIGQEIEGKIESYDDGNMWVVLV